MRCRDSHESQLLNLMDRIEDDLMRQSIDASTLYGEGEDAASRLRLCVDLHKILMECEVLPK